MNGLSGHQGVRRGPAIARWAVVLAVAVLLSLLALAQAAAAESLAACPSRA